MRDRGFMRAKTHIIFRISNASRKLIYWEVTHNYVIMFRRHVGIFHNHFVIHTRLSWACVRFFTCKWCSICLLGYIYVWPSSSNSPYPDRVAWNDHRWHFPGTHEWNHSNAFSRVLILCNFIFNAHGSWGYLFQNVILFRPETKEIFPFTPSQ